MFELQRDKQTDGDRQTETETDRDRDGTGKKCCAETHRDRGREGGEGRGGNRGQTQKPGHDRSARPLQNVDSLLNADRCCQPTDHWGATFV